jgi:hypothetical protein
MPLPVALAEHHIRTALRATPGEVSKQRIDILLHKALAQDAAHFIAAAYAAKNLFLRGTHVDNVFSYGSPRHPFGHVCSPERPIELQASQTKLDQSPALRSRTSVSRCKGNKPGRSSRKVLHSSNLAK